MSDPYEDFALSQLEARMAADDAEWLHCRLCGSCIDRTECACGFHCDDECCARDVDS